MNSIKFNSTYELIIKNSRFITILIKVNDIDNIKSILDNIKKEYKDATHYCYAYIIGEYKKSSDDGEPGGTAGVPILKVLDNNNLSNVMAVVVRYFGGIKLGAGGLVRAYTKSVTEAIKNNQITSLVTGYNVNINFEYSLEQEINYILKNTDIKKKEYHELITYNLDLDDTLLNILKTKDIKIDILNNTYIEK